MLFSICTNCGLRSGRPRTSDGESWRVRGRPGRGPRFVNIENRMGIYFKIGRCISSAAHFLVNIENRMEISIKIGRCMFSSFKTYDAYFWDLNLRQRVPPGASWELPGGGPFFVVFGVVFADSIVP